MIKRQELKSYLIAATAAIAIAACNSGKATTTTLKAEDTKATEEPQRRPHKSPATPYPIQYAQPSGDTLTIRLYGDERYHWAETIDGYLILQKKDGTYEYAYRETNGKQVSMGIVATNADKRTPETIKAIEKAKVR